MANERGLLPSGTPTPEPDLRERLLTTTRRIIAEGQALLQQGKELLEERSERFLLRNSWEQSKKLMEDETIRQGREFGTEYESLGFRLAVATALAQRPIESLGASGSEQQRAVGAALAETAERLEEQAKNVGETVPATMEELLFDRYVKPNTTRPLTKEETALILEFAHRFLPDVKLGLTYFVAKEQAKARNPFPLK